MQYCVGISVSFGPDAQDGTTCRVLRRWPGTAIAKVNRTARITTPRHVFLGMKRRRDMFRGSTLFRIVREQPSRQKKSTKITSGGRSGSRPIAAGLSARWLGPGKFLHPIPAASGPGSGAVAAPAPEIQRL